MKQKGFAHKVALGLAALTGFSNPHFLRTREPMVSVAKAQDVFKLPLNDIKKAITNGKKFELQIPELNRENRIEARFFIDNGTSTLNVSYGGGLTIYSRRVNKVARNEMDLFDKEFEGNDIGSPGFGHAFPDGAGYTRMTVLEVPFKGPDGKERGLIVNDSYGVGLLTVYARNYKTGEWQRVGGFDFDSIGLAKNIKPNVGISYVNEVDPDLYYNSSSEGKDQVLVFVTNPETNKTKGALFSIPRNRLSQEFEIIPSDFTAQQGKTKLGMLMK